MSQKSFRVKLLRRIEKVTEQDNSGQPSGYFCINNGYFCIKSGYVCIKSGYVCITRIRIISVQF